MREQGLDSLEDARRDEIHARSEAAMRAAIRALPDGVYRHTAVSDGVAEPIELEMKMTVKDDSIDDRFRRLRAAGAARDQRVHGLHDRLHRPSA